MAMVLERYSMETDNKIVRWLHLSDFHTGKDDYGQRQLFKYILDHVSERITKGESPDLVFITGDIANNGLDVEYRQFYDQFYIPLLERLPPDSRNRVFIVPGNHDVDRNQVRAVQTKDILLRVTNFLDPTEDGKFERQTVFPRFKAFVENDLGIIESHWLNSTEGVFQTVEEIHGVKLGILGINSAWLSIDENDRHNLSGGKGLLEIGLETICKSDIKIVIGHHPIDWFLDSELEPIRAVLGQHNALYLHGHMHKGRSRYEESGGYAFLDIQTGACFQARENEIWLNRLLWCELDLSTFMLNVEPLQWSKDHQEWVTDGEAFPPRYQKGNRWLLPLPTEQQSQLFPKVVAKTDFQNLQTPTGWDVIDTHYLSDRNKGISPEQVLSFFDGRSPIWREALASQIPQREIVGKVVSDLERARIDGELRVTLITGAAGEGKTTALLQIVSNLVNNNPSWGVLWRYDSDRHLPAEFISRLPDDKTWLIVSDDAEVIARRVFDSVQALKLAGNKNIQYLLCCRDTDWRAAEVDILPWSKYAVFVTEKLGGLTKYDAELMISAWARFGKEGLKMLDGLDNAKAVMQLLAAAKSESSSVGEGSFFGAILQVRWGEGLGLHIENLLRKLEKIKIGNEKTLLNAFAYISAMHAENLQILSKEVLGEVLDIPIRELKKRVLGPLGEEAVIATTGRMVFTRHHAIAKMVMQILSDKFYVDVEDLFSDLVRSARQAYLTPGTFIPALKDWTYLSSYFFDKGNQSLGIQLAHSILQVEPDNKYLIVNLAMLYRKAGQPEKGIKIFKSAPPTVIRDRGFYFEWGTTEGLVGNHAQRVLLSAYSLADESSSQPVDNNRAKLSLTGLSIAFAELHDRFSGSVFIEACSAAAQLGLRLRLDPKTKTILEQNRTKTGKIPDMEVGIALSLIMEGVVESRIQIEEEIPTWLNLDKKLTFSKLEKLINNSVFK